MAGRKMKKAPKEEECCSTGGGSNIESWFLILLGAVGLLIATGLFTLGAWGYYFQYAWSIMAIVIGMMLLMKGKSCCC